MILSLTITPALDTKEAGVDTGSSPAQISLPRSRKPDIFYGARPEQLDRQVRRELAGHIIPSTQEDAPMLPNLFLEVKGPDGSLAVAGRQACYDGALGARAMHSLQSFGASEPVYDRNAYTVTSAYHGGTLKMYTTYPAKS
jgi:hypothetical protein